MFWKVPQLFAMVIYVSTHFRNCLGKKASKKFLAGMIGKFMTERGEITKKSFVVGVTNGVRPMDDLSSCLTLRNIDLKRDEKHKKSENTTEECIPKNSLPLESILPLAFPRHSTRKKNDARPEIHIEGISLSHQNHHGGKDKISKMPCVQSIQNEQTACSSKANSQGDGIATNTEDRSLMNTPESVNTPGDYGGQHTEVNVLGSAKVQRNLNPSPWKEIWSVLQDKSLANCPLSTKSVEFGRDTSESPFSTRTNPYTKTRREKPQRIPPLYNTRKTFPTTHGEAKIPSFDAVVTFDNLFKGDQDIGVAFDIGKCKERVKLADSKEQSLQIENSDGHTCGKCESKDKTEATLSLPNITCPPADRYKSKFRVRLLPLVTKSDSLPNLTSKTTSAPSELIVTAPTSDARSTENIHISCPKNEEIKNEFVKGYDLMNKCRQNRSMSLDSVFSVHSFTAYQEERNASSKIKLEGFQVLLDIKHKNKCQQPLKQSDKEDSGIPSQMAVITLPWKCN